MLLVELPPAYLSSPCGKTATRFFGQRETPRSSRPSSKKREGEAFFVLSSSGPRWQERERPTDRHTRLANTPSADLQICQTIFSTPVRSILERGGERRKLGSKNFTIKIFCFQRFNLFQFQGFNHRFILKFGIIFRSPDFFCCSWEIGFFGLDGIFLSSRSRRLLRWKQWTKLRRKQRCSSDKKNLLEKQFFDLSSFYMYV